MLTIGIELNHVVRNINRQMLKYYQKSVDNSLEIDDIDDKTDVLNKYIKFDEQSQKNNFIYIDYPFEIFGAANAAEKHLAVKITNWLTDITNIEDEDIRIIYYTLHEEALTIQSTYFFLSKMGTRVRTMLFPKNVKEVWDECDAVITTNTEFFEQEKPSNKKIVLVNREWNEPYKEQADLTYNGLTEIIEDTEFFNKLKKDTCETKI